MSISAFEDWWAETWKVTTCSGFEEDLARQAFKAGQEVTDWNNVMERLGKILASNKQGKVLRAFWKSWKPDYRQSMETISDCVVRSIVEGGPEAICTIILAMEEEKCVDGIS
jgi:hypothetical protein